MKKFSKVKYFGAVAAALLAVAPVAAPVVSSIASPAVVEAATETREQIAQMVLNYMFGDGTAKPTMLQNSQFYNYTTAKALSVGNDGDFVPNSSDSSSPTLIGALLDADHFSKLSSGSGSGSDFANGTPVQIGQLSVSLKDYKLKAEFAGYPNESGPQLATDLLASGKSSFSVNLYLYDQSGEELATKTVTLSLSDVPIAPSSVSVSGATTVVGSSTAPFKTTASFVNATQFNGAAATTANFGSFAGFTKSTSKQLSSDQLSAAKSFADSNSVFAKAGTYYALYSVDPSSIAISGKPTESVRSSLNTTDNTTTWYVARRIVVGDYAESSATGTAYVTNGQNATLYSDPTTATSTGKTLDFGSAWKVYGVVKNSAGTVLAYNLGGSQYVKASDVSSTPVSTQGGVFTVRYPANNKWSIAVYNGSLKVQKLIPAGSIWATFGTKTLNDGKSYYNVGGDQWVRTDYGYWNAK